MTLPTSCPLGRRRYASWGTSACALGSCQPVGSFVTTLADLRRWLREMAQAGEVVVVDGLATRVQRPSGWATRCCPCDTKRHAHTAQGLAISTIHGDLLWVDGGRPASPPRA